jgi:hypothetical protein
MSEHTKEPWIFYGEEDGDFIIFGNTPEAKEFVANVGSEGALQAVMSPPNGLAAFDLDLANARRIVACVNACEGSETEVLEKLGADFIKPLIDLIDDRANLLAMEAQILHVWQCKQKAIAAHNRHIKELDDWMKCIEADLNSITRSAE